jgi:iron complex transport system permease protein
MLAGFALGPAAISLGKVISFVFGDREVLSPAERLILGGVRLPRVLLAALVGGGLAVAGGVMQGLFRNPLASPYTLGVASGASTGAALVITLGLSKGTLWALPAGAFIGAMAAALVAGGVARARRGVSPLTLILAGIAIATLFSASTSVLIYLANPEEMGAIVVWLMGGLGRASPAYVHILWPLVLMGLVVALSFARDLDILALGEEQAMHIGVAPVRTRWILLSAATLMTSAAVACAGPIGFVGLIVPHAVRLVLGPSHTRLLTACAVAGAGFLVWADLGARLVLRPVELPVGIITAFLGVPFFLYLLRRGVVA